MRKIVFEDIPSTFSAGNPEVLWQIIRTFAQKPGTLIDYQNMANEIGFSNKTVSSYLYSLEESFLVKKLYNFSRNRITSEKKLKRFYLASPSVSWALTEFHDTGRLVENLAASLKSYKFFSRDPYHHEVDFIDIEPDDTIVPTEVKYKERIQPKDLKNLFIFAKKFGARKAVILRKGVDEGSTMHQTHDLEIMEKPVYAS